MNLFFRKFYIWSCNSKLDFFSKPKDNIVNYNKDEIIQSNGMLTFPNFYFDYNNTEAGFILNIVNKFFSDEEINIDFNIAEECYYASNKYGKFKITKDLVMKDFDQNFKEYLKSKGINADEIALYNEKDEFNVDEEDDRKNIEDNNKEDDKHSTGTYVEKNNCCCIIF